MDLDKFGEIIDNFLKDNNIAMWITVPEGTLDPVIKDNTGMGPVIKFYQMCRKTPSFSYGDIRHVHRIYASN